MALTTTSSVHPGAGSGHTPRLSVQPLLKADTAPGHPRPRRRDNATSDAESRPSVNHHLAHDRQASVVTRQALRWPCRENFHTRSRASLRSA